jgi:hypothetical protein
MRRILAALFALFFTLHAFAQASGAEPPVEKASPLTVGIFVLLFIGGCVGYLLYTWWAQGKRAKVTDEETPVKRA